MQENRLAKAEAQLSGRQRVLAWIHRRQQRGGLVQMVTRGVETNLASSTPIIIERREVQWSLERTHHDAVQW